MQRQVDPWNSLARQSESMSSGSVRSFVSKNKMVRKIRHVISFSGLSTHEHIHIPHTKTCREGVVETGRKRKEGEREYKRYGCIGKC